MKHLIINFLRIFPNLLFVWAPIKRINVTGVIRKYLLLEIKIEFFRRFQEIIRSKKSFRH